MKITFCGAAGEVTGSQHLIESGNLRILLDCGLFQGHRASSRAKNETFICRPRDLDAVILSHAHIDHCGNLPGLYRENFRGDIFCTPPTADVTGVMLEDSVRIQSEDARYLNRHHPGNLPRIMPLYDEEHVRRVTKQLVPLDYGAWHDLYPELRIRFRDAGHILGSAIVELEFQEKGEVKRVVFTGDLGRRDLPLLRDPELVNGCDVLITESTYGNKIHEPADDLKSHLLRVIREAVAANGKVIIPAFSLGRTQNVVYFLNELTNSGELPNVPVFVDSPLSRKLTDIYRNHPGVFDQDLQNTLKGDKDPFGFRGLQYISSQDESIALNRRPGPMVIVAASGMCEGGRVLHHLKHNVSRPENVIVIIGFQASGTLGRRIVERQPYLKILDREYPLRAKVEILNGLSAHADANDFKWWFDHMASTTGIGQAFIVHGEAEPAKAVAQLLRDASDEDAIIPQLHQSFED